MRLKTNSAMFSAAMSDSRVMTLAIVPSAPRSAAAISPPTRPTPTTEIGPLGSRSPDPKAAWTTPTIFCGTLTTTPAVVVNWFQTNPGTCRTVPLTSSPVGVAPR